MLANVSWTQRQTREQEETNSKKFELKNFLMASKWLAHKQNNNILIEAIQWQKAINMEKRSMKTILASDKLRIGKVKTDSSSIADIPVKNRLCWYPQVLSIPAFNAFESLNSHLFVMCHCRPIIIHSPHLNVCVRWHPHYVMH